MVISAPGCDSTSSETGQNNKDDENGIEIPACKAAVSGLSVQERLVQLQQTERPAEAFQHRLNEQIPGFGGIYIDKDGNHTVYLKDVSVQAMASSVIANSVSFKSTGSHQSASLIFKKGGYTFRELAGWRELITAYLLTHDELDFVLSNYIDESSNRVVIGIEENAYHDAGPARVKAYLNDVLNIPLDAIEIEPDYVLMEDSEESPDNLSGEIFDRQRPLTGGLRIRYGSSSRCTMGFLGIYNGRDVFVTNSHCTDLPHRTGSTVFYQGERGEPEDEIGLELNGGEPAQAACITPNSDCWPCKWSDAAIIELNDGIPTAQGTIAKTTWVSDDWMANGSLVIDENDPVFSIQEVEYDVLMGMNLHKAGGNSGWSSGEVIRTCVDSRRSSHQLILQCQHRAKYATDGGGTSGSPVFIRLNPDDYDGNETSPVALIGIHWGSSSRDDPSGYSVFSPISGVLEDFEGLHVLVKEESQIAKRN